MMRKFTTYLFISCSSWFLLSSCDDDEVSAPPKTSFMQDKTSVLTRDTVTFVVDQVDADAIALLPYGQEQTGLSGVLIPKSSFSSGKASVKFSYSEVGTFSPVVVTTNYSEDGESIERTYSDATSINVASDNRSITAFSFVGSTKTTINQEAATIVVEMPYANDKGVPYGKDLKAKFTASNFATVRVGNAIQTSEATTNNFNNPVVYTVTANNGSTKNYTVTLSQDPIETDPSFKSFGGKALSKSYKDKELQGYVNNVNDFVVLLAPFGQTVPVFDSVRVRYETTGRYSIVHYNTAIDTLRQDSLLDVSVTPRETVAVEAQNETTATYTLEYAIAPKFEAKFNALVPSVTGSTTDFEVMLDVLKGTDTQNLATTLTISPNTGQNISGVTWLRLDDDTTNDTPVVFPFVAGTGTNSVNFKDVENPNPNATVPVRFDVTINDTNINETYVVSYTVNVDVLE